MLPRRLLRLGLGDFVMRTSPSIAPHGGDHDTYIVLDDLGHLGRCWRETDADTPTARP